MFQGDYVFRAEVCELLLCSRFRLRKEFPDSRQIINIFLPDVFPYLEWPALYGVGKGQELIPFWTWGCFPLQTGIVPFIFSNLQFLTSPKLGCPYFCPPIKVGKGCPQLVPY